MKSFDQGFGKRAAAVMLSLATMSLLPACEKGLMLKDPKITAPDFKIETQIPKADEGQKAAFIVDLLGVQLTAANPEAAAEAKEYKATITYKIGFEAAEGEEDKSRTVNLDIQIKDKNPYNTAGRIPHQNNEPEMIYQARCVGDDCSKLYVSITLDFKDAKGLTQESKVLVIGRYAELNLVKRHLFDADLELNTLTKQVQALELMNANDVKMPQAGDVKVDEGVAAGTGSTQELEQQKSAPVEEAPSEETVTENTQETDESQATNTAAPTEDAADDGE